MEQRLFVGLGVILCIFAAVPACGGSVVFVEDGEGGSGGTASSSKGGSVSGSKSASASKSSVVSAQSSTVVGTPTTCSLPDTALPQNCPEACSDLFDCGLLSCGGQQNCPGFFPGQQQEFMMGCLQFCSQQMALIAIIDPSNCDTTVQTLETLNSEFQAVCQGFDG